MRDLRRMGLRTVILQWSSINAVDFYPGRPNAANVRPVLSQVIRAAHEAGLRTWLGLHHDGAWWSAAARSDAELETYLAARIADLDARLPALGAVGASVPSRAIAGWYIPDELDDATWRTPEREAALTRYLRLVRSRLARAAPRRPAAISAFANHAQDPAKFGMQLGRVCGAGGIGRVLLQDGIGAGKSTVEQARETARGVAEVLGGSLVQLGMVVELFDMQPAEAGQGNATVPAPLGSVLARLAATAGAGDLPPVSFSHAHHLTPFGGAAAAAHGAEWMRMLGRCGPRPR